MKGFGDEIPKRDWDRSLPPPVAETGRRSVGNRKERRWRDYASFPGGSPTLSCWLEKKSYTTGLIHLPERKCRPYTMHLNTSSTRYMIR